MSTLKVGGIRGVSASSDAITVANDGTCTANITSIGDGQLSNRNIIINGGMMVNQRYGDTANTPTDGKYTMDRWQAWMSTNSKFSVTRSDDHPDDFDKSLLVTSLSAATVTADHEHGITTKIEGQNMARLAFGTSSAKSATLSFYVKSSLTGTFGGLVANSALNMSYVFSYTVDSANTWERKTITIPPTTSGTFLGGSSHGLQVHFEFGVGSNRTAAVGWQTNTSVRGVSSQVNLIATNAATWRMTGLQLEVGTTATDFEHRSYGQELALCQRYYYKHAEGNNKDFGAGGYYTSGLAFGSTFFPTTMRVAPAMEHTTGTDYYGVYRDGALDGFNNLVLHSAHENSCAFDSGTGTSGTAGHAGRFVLNNASAYLAFTAEL